MPTPNPGATISGLANTPPSRESSTRDARKYARILRRLEIAEKLSRARPDLVAPSYAAKRERLVARNARFEVKEQYLAGLASVVRPEDGVVFSSYQTVDDGDGGMNWDRSRQLAEGVLVEVMNGRRPMLPLVVSG
jgi:hypothetical protein